MSMKTAISAIQDIDALDIKDVAELLKCLGLQMKQSGFADVDVDCVEEIKDFICGETA